jgi:hypothetical protein
MRSHRVRKCGVQRFKIKLSTVQRDVEVKGKGNAWVKFTKASDPRASNKDLGRSTGKPRSIAVGQRLDFDVLVLRTECLQKGLHPATRCCEPPCGLGHKHAQPLVVCMVADHRAQFEDTLRQVMVSVGREQSEQPREEMLPKDGVVDRDRVRDPRHSMAGRPTRVLELVRIV